MLENHSGGKASFSFIQFFFFTRLPAHFHFYIFFSGAVIKKQITFRFMNSSGFLGLFRRG